MPQVRKRQSQRNYAPLLGSTRALFLGEGKVNLADQDGANVDRSADIRVLAQMVRHSNREYPIRSFPAVPLAYATELAACSSVPMSLVAASILAVGSAAILDRLRVAVRADVTTPANLYILPFARSGTGKTSALSRVRAAIEKLANAEIAKFECEIRPNLLKQKAECEAAIRTFREALFHPPVAKKIEEEYLLAVARLPKIEAEIEEPCYVTEEATSEFAEKTAQRMRGRLTLMSDDARGCLDILCGKYTRGQTNESLFLKAFSLAPHRAGRIGRGSVQIDEMCFSVLWMVQPDKINTLFRNAAFTEGGLLPRFLVEHVDCDPAQWRDEGYSPSGQELWEETIARIWNRYRLIDEPLIVDVTREARELYYAANERLHRERKEGDLIDVLPYSSRWEEQAIRLGLVLHTFKYLDKAHEHKLDIHTAKASLDLASYYADCQLAMLEEYRTDERRTLIRKAMELADRSEGVTVRELVRATRVPSAEAQKVLDLLKSEGELTVRERTPDQGGHKFSIYSTHILTNR